MKYNKCTEICLPGAGSQMNVFNMFVQVFELLKNTSGDVLLFFLIVIKSNDNNKTINQ